MTRPWRRCLRAFQKNAFLLQILLLAVLTKKIQYPHTINFLILKSPTWATCSDRNTRSVNIPNERTSKHCPSSSPISCLGHCKSHIAIDFYATAEYYLSLTSHSWGHTNYDAANTSFTTIDVAAIYFHSSTTWITSIGMLRINSKVSVTNLRAVVDNHL